MNKRKNEDAENGGTRKKNTTLDTENAKSEAVVKQTASALKVNVDEWEEVFDYTSLKDLHSMAKTCKRMQAIAGWYFRTYYINRIATVDGPEIHIDGMVMNGFREHISHLKIQDVFCDFSPIRKYQFNSLRTITFQNMQIPLRMVESVNGYLNKLECIKLRGCRYRGDLYETFLKFCTNLRTLYIEYRPTGIFIDGIGNGWLLHEYPTLEHIELYFHNSQGPMVELKTFLEKNSNLKSLTIHGRMYETYQQLFMETNCALETFSIDFYGRSLGELRTQLNALHGRGFYKRLKLKCFGLQDSTDLSFLQGLDKLYLTGTPEVSTSINVKKITIDGMRYVKGAIEHFINVNTLVIRGSTKPNDLLLTLGHFPALKTLTCQGYDGEYLDLPDLNAERAKLTGARKVTIFVRARAYLTTKLKFGHLDFCFVAVKRDTFFDY